MTHPTTMTTLEAANELGVTTPTIRRSISEGILKGRRIGPRTFRVSRAAVEELIFQNEAGAE